MKVSFYVLELIQRGLMKKINYVILIAIVVSLNVFTIFAYPNNVYAMDDTMKTVNVAATSNVGQAILVTEYLFVNTPNIGDIISVDDYFNIDTKIEYQVEDVITDKNGLDAFVLRDANDNLILSIRGTEGSAWDGDVEVDAKLILNQNEQYTKLMQILSKKDYYNDLDYVVGHSLGAAVALNASLNLIGNNVNLKKVYAFAPAPMITDEYVTDENIKKLNDILTLAVIDNEFLYNFGNQIAGKLKPQNPYALFDYQVVAISDDIDNGFANHYISKFIPVVTGQESAKHELIKIN